MADDMPVQKTPPPATPPIYMSVVVDDEFGQLRGNEDDKTAGNSNETADGKYRYLRGLPLYNVVATVMLGALLLGLDINVIATAVPTIIDHFRSLRDISWYSSAYLVAVCAVQPLSGKLYTYFSTKYTYIAHMVVFQLGNMICALANSSEMVIAGRAVSGIGGAGLFNGLVVILTASTPPKVRPAILAAGVSMIPIGGILGPLIGGALTQHTSWRWCFWIFLPPGGIAILITLLIHIPEQMIKPRPLPVLKNLPTKIDLPGFVFFAAACTMFLISITWGGGTYRWDSAPIIGLFCGSGVALIAFITWTLYRQDEALIPPRWLKTRVLFVGCWICGLQGGATLMIGYYLPEYFQSSRGASPQNSGLMMLPTMISQIIGSGLSGALVRRLRYIPPWAIFGSILTTIGTGFMTRFSPDSPQADWIGWQVCAGFGRGLALNMPFISAQEELPPEGLAVATSAIILCQYLAGSISISLAQTILQNSFPSALRSRAPGLDAAAILAAGATRFGEVVQPEQLSAVVAAYDEALVKVFFIPTATAALSVIISCFFSWNKIELQDKGEDDPDGQLNGDSSEEN